MKQRGFSSVLLIAIIVLLAGMTRFALQFVGGAEGAAALQLQAARAQRAAEAGIEWQRYQLRNFAPGGCAPATNFGIPSVSGNFPVTVTCSRTPNAGVIHQENGVSVYTYSFTATACWPAGAGGRCPNPAAVLPSDYVERAVTAQAACVAGPICTW
ncbi:MAG: hypothetical protein ACM3VZ_10565 [Acidobacteriota bacterium]